MKLWKTLLVATAIVGATAGAVAYMAKSDDSTEIAAPDEPIWDARTTTVALGNYRPQIKLIGQVEPVRDLSEVALLAAEVTDVFFKDGMRVEEGQTILKLDDFDAQLQVQQTQADIADLNARIKAQQTQHQLDISALEVEKNQLSLLQDQLKKQKAITNTQSAIADLEQQIQRQQFAVLQREAAIDNHPIDKTQLSIQKQKLALALKSAQRNLEQTELKAPFSGTLAQLFVKEGMRVNPGQTVFRLYSADEMAVLAQLPTRLLTEKEQLDGIAYEQKRISNVQYDRSEAQLNTGQSGFRAWFLLDDATQWLPGDIAYLSLNLAAQNQTLQIPAASVFQDRWIYSVDDEQRLNALEISVLGSVDRSDRNELIVETKTDVDSDLRLLVTRLNNPTTGMKIYEKGVDPEPVEPVEEDDSEANEDDQAGDEQIDESTDTEVSDEDA